MQGVQNGDHHFQFTRFEETPFLIYALSKIYQIFYDCNVIIMIRPAQ